MGSRIPILLSLALLPFSSFAETAGDYANRGAQKYIFGQDEAAEAEITTGLAKFPNDRELNQIAGLLKKKPKQEQKSQGQQPQQQQQNQSGNDQQKPDQNKEGNENKEPKPGETPTPWPGDDQRQNQPGSSPSPSADQGSGGDKQDEQQPPSQGDQDASPSPSPSPGTGEASEPEGSPSPTPGKKLSGEVKGADQDKPDEPPPDGELVQAEPEKEGQMSEKQAQQLLQSMKDEEKRVQLDERKAPRRVYKDW